MAIEWVDKLKTIMRPNSFVLLRLTKFNGEYFYYYIEMPTGKEPYIQSFMSIEGEQVMKQEKFPKGFYTSVAVFSDDKPIKGNCAFIYSKGETIKKSFRLMYDKIKFANNGRMIYRTDGSAYAMLWYSRMVAEKSLTYDKAKSNKFEKNRIKEKNYGNSGSRNQTGLVGNSSNGSGIDTKLVGS
jgi:hypothetical protein